MRQPGLPGLALVLALTMVLGFAATASAAGYGYGRFERDLFVAGYKVPYTINGEEDTEFDVEGNKEYTVKAKIDVDNIVNYPDVIDDIYDDLDQEYQVLELINQYANFDFYASADWTGEASNQPTSIYGDGNPLYTAVAALISSTDPVNGTPSSTIYKELVEAVQKNGNNFEKGYKSNAFQSAFADLDRAMRNSSYGVNSYYGYEDGIAVYATSKDSTYATVTSAPTVKFTREGNDTFCNVEFKVRFTNTTFRTADVDVEVKYLSGGSDTNIQYEHTDTLSFTVFQAAGCPRWRVAHGGGIENKRLAPAMRRGEESGGRGPPISAGILRINYRGDMLPGLRYAFPLSSHT